MRCNLEDPGGGFEVGGTSGEMRLRCARRVNDNGASTVNNIIRVNAVGVNETSTTEIRVDDITSRATSVWRTT